MQDFYLQSYLIGNKASTALLLLCVTIFIVPFDLFLVEFIRKGIYNLTNQEQSVDNLSKLRAIFSFVDSRFLFTIPIE